MSKPKMSAPAAAIEVLRKEGGPLHVKVITERILENYDTGLKGKTPEATLGAKLHVSANKGETFRKVAPGTFELLPESDQAPKPTKAKATKPKASKAKAAAAEEVAPEVEATDTAELETPDVEAEHDPRATAGAVIVRRGTAQVKPDPKPSPSTTRPRGRKVAAAA